MSSYIIKVTNGADVGTIENQIDVGFRYTDKLNAMNEAEIKISSLGSVKRGLLAMGAQVEISRNGNLEFKGLIDNIDNLDAGSVNVHVSGFELRLVQEKGVYANSPWKATASATINSEVIAESSYFTAGTINAGVNIDQRFDKAQSLWNALGNLATKTGQDIQVDYTNNEIDILDNRGSLTSVATFNDGIQIQNIRVSTSYPKGNWVKVYGKGDGVNQIESDDAQGVDAASQSTYGIIKEVIIDRSIISVDEANKRANIEVAKIKDPLKIYDFEVINFGAAITTGDLLTLNSQDKDLTNESVRIVGMARGIQGDREFLTLQVTNSEFSQILKTQNALIGKMYKDNIDSNSYMQGGTNVNTWGNGINAKTSYPLKIGFYVPNAFKDEAGNLQINTLEVDYDIDPYKEQYGDATFTGSDPQVQNNSGNTGPDVSGTSAGQTPTAIAGVSVWTALFGTIGTTAAVGYVEENLAGGADAPSLDTSRGEVLVSNQTGGSVTVHPEIDMASGNTITGTATLIGNLTVLTFNTGESNSGNSSGYFKGREKNYVGSYVTAQQLNVYTHSHGSHSHGDGSYAAASHLHPDGSYDINAADLNNIVVGDGVGEAGSVNATGVTLYLDFWSGSAWVNKHSVVVSGTLETENDISDSGTYPDASGYWRVRIDPNSASSDFIQGIVRLKLHIDS